jgi:hypothetical protein
MMSMPSTTICKDSGHLTPAFSDFVQAALSSAWVNGRVVCRNGKIHIEKMPSFFSFFQKEKEQTWSLFFKAINALPISQQRKIQTIFQKYAVDSQVLEKRHLDMALVALSSLYLEDLGDNPDAGSSKEIVKKVEAFIEKAPFNRHFVLGKLSSFYEVLVADSLFLEKERVFSLYQLSKFQAEEAYFEYLTREVVSRELEEGMIVPALLGRDYYYVYRKINQEGLVGYALKPISKDSEEKPILCFRPTQMNLSAVDHVLSTFLEDLDHKGVGCPGFSAAKKELSALMKDEGFRKAKEQIIIAGYSLGGAHAQHFLASEDNWKNVFRAFFFNDPGVDQNTAHRFARKINHPDVAHLPKPVLSLFRTKGDLADHHGEKHVGEGVLPFSGAKMELTLSIPSLFASRLDRHFTRYLDRDVERIYFDLNDPKHHHLLNNAKRGDRVRFWEPLRRWIGYLARPLISFCLFLYEVWMGRKSFLSLLVFNKRKKKTSVNFS